VIAAGFHPTRAGDTAGTWDVNLPPKERAEVEQARRGNFPEGYARMLRLYYRNLGVESR
jgi:hypothetical protein